MTQTIKIELSSGEEVRVIFDEIDMSNFNSDNVMRINYANIPAEITTFPVLLAKVKMLIAEAKRAQALAELELKIGKSKINKQFRSSQTGSKPTVDMVADNLRCNPVYRALNQKHINATFEAEVLDGLYWAMNSKDQKLNIILKSQTNDGETLIEAISDLEGEEFNGVMIKAIK